MAAAAAAAVPPRTDVDALRAAHSFLNGGGGGGAPGGAPGDAHGERLAAAYNAALTADFALADLSRPGALGLRWRTRAEVARGKGQFICASLTCEAVTALRSFEVPFSYAERGAAKTALVRVRVCGECAAAAFGGAAAAADDGAAAGAGDGAAAAGSDEPERARGADDGARSSGRRRRRRRRSRSRSPPPPR
jgi:protein FRA10AC1